MRAEVYVDVAGEWRWRLIAGNGRIVATGHEGYVSQTYAKLGLLAILDTDRESVEIELIGVGD